MSNVTAAFQSIITLSSALALLIASFFTLLAQAIRSLFRRSSPVELVANQNNSLILDTASGLTLLDLIKQKCPSLYGPDATFRPTWWLPGGHLQTIWCIIGELIHRDPIPYARQFIRTPDGGTLSLDVYPPFESKDDDTPILFVLHGLTGSSQESYIRTTVREVSKSNVHGGKGFRVVAMNFRGCDVDTPVTSQRLYHAGETDDTRSALLYLTHTYPNAPIYGASYSMGACTMAIYLGQEGEATPLKATIGVSNPWDWVTATEHIEHGGFLNNYMYGPALADALLTVIKNSRYAFETDKRLNFKDIYSRRYVNIRFFDDRVTAPLNNFTDSWDYYRKASSTPWLDKIRVPHITLQSWDDPMVKMENLPVEQCRQSSYVIMARTYAGGHVAWWTSKGGQLTRWFATPIREILEAAHELDPRPRPAPETLPPDAKGMIRSAQYPDRVGFLPITGEGLMTARIYSASAHNPIVGS